MNGMGSARKRMRIKKKRTEDKYWSLKLLLATKEDVIASKYTDFEFIKKTKIYFFLFAAVHWRSGFVLPKHARV